MLGVSKLTRTHENDLLSRRVVGFFLFDDLFQNILLPLSSNHLT